MSPPTEQLIRDYLNRLSVAARDRLGADDRRALVDRTRKLIERRSDFAGRPTTLEVGRVLARLGDPAALVDQELRRLAAVRGGTPGEPNPSRRQRQTKKSGTLESPGTPGGSGSADRAGWGSRGFLDWVLRREPTRVGEEDRGWPARQVDRSEPAVLAEAPGGLPKIAAAATDGTPPQPTAARSPGTAAAEPAAALPAAGQPGGSGASQPTAAVPAAGQPAGSAGSERTAALPVAGQPAGSAGSERTVPPATAGPEGTAKLPRRAPTAAPAASEGTTRAAGTNPPQPQLSGWPSAAMNGRRDATRELERDADHATSNGTRVGGGSSADSEADDLVGTAGPGESDRRADKGARSGTVAEARRLVAMLASWAMRQPLEATAVVLLGVGGGIYPPFFLLGALVALGSRQWDLRDKWAGLILPLVLTVIGAAIGLAAGGRSHGLHEGWVFLNVVSRMAAVLGAGYLAWRSWQGRRPPPELPWERSRRAT